MSAAKKRRTFPCPYCKGKGGYRGSFDLGGPLEPDEPCGICGHGWGMIEVDSPEHVRLKQIKLLDAITNLFPSDLPDHFTSDVWAKVEDVTAWVASEVAANGVSHGD